MYIGIGLVIYLFMENKDGGESLQKVHENAPAIILSVIVILLLLNFIKSRRRKKE